MTNSVNPPGPGLHWQKRSRIYCQHRQSGGGNTPAPGSAPRPCPSLRPPAAGTCPAPHNKRGRGGAGAGAGGGSRGRQRGQQAGREPQGRRGQRHAHGPGSRRTHTHGPAPRGRVPRARAAAGRAGSRRRQGGSSAPAAERSAAKRLSGLSSQPSGRGGFSAAGGSQSASRPAARARPAPRRPPRRTLPRAPAAGGERARAAPRGSVGRELLPRRPRRPPVSRQSPATGGWECARVCVESPTGTCKRDRERERDMHTHRSVCGTARSPRQAVVSPHS